MIQINCKWFTTATPPISSRERMSVFMNKISDRRSVVNNLPLSIRQCLNDIDFLIKTDKGKKTCRCSFYMKSIVAKQSFIDLIFKNLDILIQLGCAGSVR